MADPVKVVKLSEKFEVNVMAMTTKVVPINLLTAMTKATTQPSRDDAVKLLRAALEKSNDKELKDRLGLLLDKPAELFKDDGSFKPTVTEDVKKAMLSGLGDSMVMIKDADGKEYVALGTSTADSFTVRTVVPVPDGIKDPAQVMDKIGKDPDFILKALTSARFNPEASPVAIKLDDIDAFKAEVVKVAKADPLVKPNVTPPPPTPAEPAKKATLSPAVTEAKTKAVTKMLSEISAPDKAAQDKVVARLTKLAAAMPPGDKKNALEAALKSPDKMFKDGKLSEDFKKTFSENFADLALEVKTAKGGKNMIAFGTVEGGAPKGKFKIIAEMPVDAAGKADALDKVKLPKNPADPKLQVDVNLSADGVPSFEDTAMGTLSEDLDGIDTEGESLDAAATPGAPPPQPKVGGTKVIGSRKGFFEKLLNPGAGIGAIIGGILGFMGLGPLGAIIGALLGGLGGSMLTGNSPFEDKADMVIAPGDSRIQVRTPEGDAPKLNMKMDGPPGFDLMVTGKANAAGQFEMTEAVLQPKAKGQQARRLPFNPPKVVATSADGFVNKDDIYTSVLGPDAQKILAGTTPPPAIGSGPDVKPPQPGKDDGKKADSPPVSEEPKPAVKVEKINSAWVEPDTKRNNAKEGSHTAIYNIGTGTNQGKKRFQVEAKVTKSSKIEITRLFDRNAKPPREIKLDTPIVLGTGTYEFFDDKRIHDALKNSPELLAALQTNFDEKAVPPAPKMDADVSMTDATVKPEATEKKYVVKGADGKVMGVVKGRIQGSKFIVSEFGDGKDAKDSKKTTELAEFIQVDLVDGKVDFGKVLTAVRTKVASAQIPVEVAEMETRANDKLRDGTPADKPLPGELVTMRVEVGKDPKQSFRIDGMKTPEGKLVVKQITGFGSDPSNPTPKLMVLGKDEFTLDLEADKAEMTKVLMSSPQVQKAFINFSAVPGNTSVASLTTPSLKAGDFVSPNINFSDGPANKEVSV